MIDLLLHQSQAPGDVVMMTAAVRDLLRYNPDKYRVAVRTRYPELWENNPWIIPDDQLDPNARVIEMHYPSVQHANTRPRHFIEGYHSYLRTILGEEFLVSEFRGDIHLSLAERDAPPAAFRRLLPDRYWILATGCKPDFSAKWWTPNHWQEVVNHLRGHISFVHVAGPRDLFSKLHGVIDLAGETSHRELISLIYHSEGVLSLVSLPMHLAAAVPVKDKSRPLRPCVVIAGGREPPHWEAYPGHQFLHTVGMLDCCAEGGCWRSRCQQLGDGHRKDHRDLCEQPVQVSESLRIARCMDMIWPADVLRAMELYDTGWKRPVHA